MAITSCASKRIFPLKSIAHLQSLQRAVEMLADCQSWGRHPLLSLGQGLGYGWR